MNKYIAHGTTSGHVYFVVTWINVRSSWYFATGRGSPSSSSGAGGSGSSGSECFANIGAVRVKTIMSQHVAIMQAERAFVYVLAKIYFFVEGELGNVAQPETRWTTGWKTCITARYIDATIV